MNASVVLGCTIEVAVASHMGGVGTHPIILHQVLTTNLFSWRTACVGQTSWQMCTALIYCPVLILSEFLTPSCLALNECEVLCSCNSSRRCSCMRSSR